MATNTIRNPEDLVALFSERARRTADIYGGQKPSADMMDAQMLLTAKQAKWLSDLLDRSGWPVSQARGGHGSLPSGLYSRWEFELQRNGAGILNLWDRQGA